jgi:hypothetical protein
MPATLVGKYLFMAAVEGDVDTKFETIKNNYVQGPLLEVDDNKLKGKKLTESLLITENRCLIFGKKLTVYGVDTLT